MSLRTNLTAAKTQALVVSNFALCQGNTHLQAGLCCCLQLTMEEVGLARAVSTNCETKRILEQNVALRTSTALFYIPTVLILSLKGSAIVWSL